MKYEAVCFALLEALQSFLFNQFVAEPSRRVCNQRNTKALIRLECSLCVILCTTLQNFNMKSNAVNK